MEKAILPPPEALDTPLSEALQTRFSLREASSARAFSRSELGTLLGHALGTREKSEARTYPSGGALYPIETYLLGTIIENKPPSVLHYHPAGHALEYLWPLPDGFDMEEIVRSRTTPYGSALIVFTGVWDRSAVKYGDYAYYLSLLEAGHMAQNVLLVGTALGLQMRTIGGIDDDVVTSLLDLNPTFEQPIYGIVVSARTTPQSGSIASA